MAAVPDGGHILRALALCALLGSGAAAQPSPEPKVLLAPYSGAIVPVAAEFMAQAVDEAGRGGYDALVIQLDTPGGLDASMRDIVKSVFGSKVPVVVFIHPAGARAASAGVFIAMAAHVAAMSPGTNIGAAHPVMIGGARPDGGKGPKGGDDALEKKAVSDAAAYLKSIAAKRGRNQDWAFEAVSRSTSIPSSEAAALRVVDLESPDLAALLKAVHGRRLPDFKEPLRTAGAKVEVKEMTRRQRWLAALSDPNVAMILMSLGAGGLFIELYNPGLILPGIVGLVALLLAFYSFQTLSASYAGVLLILAGFLFFLLEIKVTSYGMLALGGVTATLLGALMLFQQEPLGGLSVSWTVIGSSIAAMLSVTALLSWIVYRAYKRQGTTGPEGMVGAGGRALGRLDPAGKVEVFGEIWDARTDDGPIEDGAAVVVESIEGLRLKVRKKA